LVEGEEKKKKKKKKQSKTKIIFIEAVNNRQYSNLQLNPLYFQKINSSDL